MAEKELSNGFAAVPDDDEETARMWAELMALAPPRDPNVTWDDLESEMQGLFNYMEGDPETDTEA